MSYLAIKHIHLICITLSLLLFMLRGTWALYFPDKLNSRWVKVVPHVIDTALLVSGITLAILLQQYPFVDHWLTAKVIALCLYIGLGSYVMKGTATTVKRLWGFIAALGIFFYIVTVALNHHPLLGFG